MATDPDALWTIPFTGRVTLRTEMDGKTMAISVPVTQGDVCHVWTKDGELRGIINLGPPETDVVMVPEPHTHLAHDGWDAPIVQCPGPDLCPGV